MVQDFQNALIMRTQFSLAVVLWLVAAVQSSAYEFVPRPDAKPLKPVNAAWSVMPETFRAGLKFPNWPMPTNLVSWEKSGREQPRRTLLSVLGDLLPRPDPAKVRVTAKEDKGDFTIEHFEFFNGADTVVPGILLIPKTALTNPAPAIIALHHFGSNKELVTFDTNAPPIYNDTVGLMLVRQGYVVAAIDGYFHGERIGRGVMVTTNASQQESDLFKLDLWFGRSLWGMMIRDQQCLLDYLETRPEVDKTRIGATGMSMGCMEADWLAALDDRVKVVASVSCFTRYEQLIAHGGVKNHSLYLYTPGMLQHFDTEAVQALIAPRPHLELCGDHDPVEPLDGIKILDEKTSALYQLYDDAENFRCIVYQNTPHAYLPEMKTEVFGWFEKHLPVNPPKN
jgi:dienelactone hydrolase